MEPTGGIEGGDMNEVDELDGMLAQADPARDRAPGVHEELIRMAAREHPLGRLRRFPSRAAVTSATIALVLAGGGAAAAATLMEWKPWAEHPDASFQYTLPSGAECELRVGNLLGADEAAEQALRDFFATQDPLTDEVIRAEIERSRAVTHTATSPDGTLIEIAWDDPRFYDADQEYGRAVSEVVTSGLWEYLEARGIEVSPDASYEGEAHCE
jgi:hypothetical protein